MTAYTFAVWIKNEALQGGKFTKTIQANNISAAWRWLIHDLHTSSILPVVTEIKLEGGQ